MFTLKFAKRIAVVVSVAMLVGAPVAAADTNPPAKPAKPLVLDGIQGESQDSIPLAHIEVQ